MDSTEREQAASSVWRSWLSTAATAALTGVLMLALARGALAGYLEVAGGLEVVAAVALAWVGGRRAARIRRAGPGARSDLPPATALLGAALVIVPVLVLGAGLLASS
ncbi:hypothetical protein [Amycolatopsis nalaikhensis]|uniref:Uncharacterized protein n=1 Tax=Amycolatopsis nalaikhensis TaxID=715472 RepID=A0ABY8XTZ7_9PSEU|nr:hypothetical protein [Amycolatopsis sp. 2-2]WIV59152.1 hypothetical protein QP939_11240 [Amycolatopsis sp. 2-2]